MSAAHPRGCGADVFGAGNEALDWGSSPRVRGRLDFTNTHPAVGGLIPAGAGQTTPAATSTCSWRAHPRGCGADGLGVGFAGEAAGSSPRVRGRRMGRRRPRYARGLIPAGAGQTLQQPCPATRRTAHPRGCGADLIVSDAFARVTGSSPRVRGRHRQARDTLWHRRLIPAGAGQTGELSPCRPGSGAHPRGCGADLLQLHSLRTHIGSSPRVRGRLLPAGERRARFRLIPAGAGQTTKNQATGASAGAHPRGCGADYEEHAKRR